MTIDERLEWLAERHQALAQSVELLAAENRQTGERIRALATIAEQNEIRAGRTQDSMVLMQDSARRMQDGMVLMQNSMTGMQDGMTRMMDAVARLAHIAGNHEERIAGLERPGD